MAVLFTEGCDYNIGSTNILRKWDSGSVATNGTSRFGVANGSIQLPSYSSPFVAASSTRILAAFWANRTAPPAGTDTFIVFCPVDKSVFGGLFMTSSGLLTVDPWGTGGGSATGTAYITDSAWHWIEFDINFANSGHAYVYVDGVLDINQPSIDMYGSGTVSIARVAGVNTFGGGTYIDDLVIWDDSGSGLTAADFPIGPQKCQTLRPTSDASVQWTRSAGSTNYENIDETYPVNTDYVSSTTVGHIDRYGYGNLTGSPIAVTTVVVNTYGVNEGVAFASFRPNLKSGASTYNGTTRTLTGTNTWYGDVWDLNPDGSVAWSPTTVNAIEAGFELIS
jgi:hypothetical protein